MKRVFIISTFAFAAACSKKNDNTAQNTSIAQVDTINHIEVSMNKWSAGYDTTDNYIASYMVAYSPHAPLQSEGTVANSSNRFGYTFTAPDL
jgi:hypothetical protein